MEHIEGYDEWKTSPPKEQKPAVRCSLCGAALYEGDYLYTVSGESLCEDCLNDGYRRML